MRAKDFYTLDFKTHLDKMKSAMSSIQEQFLESLCDGDFVKAAQLLKQGADINAFDKVKETPLQHAISYLDDPEQRFKAVQFLLEHGADPNRIDEDSGGPLIAAIHWQDERIIALLLEKGATPNVICDGGESLYDYAEFDYRYEVWDFQLPEEPCDADRETEEAWLAFLSRLAIQHHKRTPDYLYMLRNAGAKTTQELTGK